MLINNLAIKQFKIMCRNERKTTDEEVKYKILRAYNLGTRINELSKDVYSVSFGNLILNIYHEEITSLARGLVTYPVDEDKKKRYDDVHKNTKKKSTKEILLASNILSLSQKWLINAIK